MILLFLNHAGEHLIDVLWGIILFSLLFDCYSVTEIDRAVNLLQPLSVLLLNPHGLRGIDR